MRLITLYEDEKGAQEINEVASLIEQSPAIIEQFPDLPKQMRELSLQIVWQQPLTQEKRQELSKRLGMNLGRNFTDRSPLLEKMQNSARYDHEELTNRMDKLKGELERTFPESIVTARVKSPKSLAKKLKSDAYQGKSLAQVKDLIGARIISPMTKMLPESAVLVENKIDVYRKRNFFRANDDRPLNPSIAGEDYYGVNYLTEADGYSAEVQMTVRPLEVWNDLQHVLLYKPAAKPTPDVIEKLAHIRDNILWHVFMGESN
jgi:ppGpp synthetase/RelA/SpoT-type nucleotidyltranferase